LQSCKKDGTTVASIDFDALRSYELPLAPKQEQRRIVEAVESYLSRLDAATSSLAQAQARLPSYRASVLKAAVEGRLVPTEAQLARAENRDYEPAPTLVRRILTEQQRPGEPEEATNPAPVSREDRGQSPLPEGWCWATVGQLAEVSGGLTKNSVRDRFPRKLPYLRVANVYANSLALNDIKEIGVRENELPRTLLKRGDLLLVEGNGSIDQIGRVALWDGSISPMVHQNHLIKARFAAYPLARWTLTWLLSPTGRRAIERAASSTSGLHTLSISKVEKLPVPVPPALEQARILEAVDQASTIVEAMSKAITSDGKRCDRLRQSILKSAFEGKLVDQDPTDEPAEKLLERIRAERASSTSAKPKRSRTSKAAL
jgi:type I restriction enzyme S subunit